MSIAIKEIMKKDYSKLSSSDSVESAVELIEKRGVDYLLVEEEGEIKGVVTSHELVGYPSSRLLVDCRIKPIATMSEETWLNEALKVLEEKEVNFLVVLNKEGSPIGVINKEMILSFLYQEVKKSNKENEREVTERKRAEEALQASETEKKSILNAISDVVAFQDKSLSIRWANEAAARSVGKTPQELVGGHCYELWHGQSEPCEGCPVLRAQETGSSAGGIMTTPDGRWWEITAEPVRDIDEKIVGAMEIARDITERKQAEEALRESEERYRTLVEGLEDVIVSFSLDGTILYCSPNAKNFGGYDAEEEIGHHFIRYIADEEAKQKLQDIFQDVVTTKKPVSFEFLYKPKNKEPFYVEATASPNISKISNAIVSIQCIVRDITERKQAEEELVRSEEKFRSVVENSNDVICIVQDGLLKFVNKQIAKLTGYSLGDFVDKPFISYIHPDDLQKIKKKYERFMTGEEDEQRYEIGVRHKDGHKIEVELNISVTYYEGRRAGLVFVRDITERKRVEEELHESEEKIRSMSASAQDAIIMMNNEGNILYWNEAAERIFGYTEEEIIGKKLHETMVPERFHEDISKGFKRFQETGQGAAIGKTLELAAVRKDGTEFPIELSLSAVMIKGKWNAIGIIRDITERKRAEEALRESEERYRSIFESIQDVYAEVAMDGTILEISPSIQSFSGYAPEEVLGRSLAEFYVYPEQRAALLERLRLGGSVNDYEVVLRHKTGRAVTSAFTVKVVTDAFGTPVKIVGTMRDVTERKRLDDERERLIKKLGALDKMKTNFLNVAYHEMRSPLAPIVGYASLLEQSALNEKQKKYARIIEESAYKLEELIESLLEVTRLEAGKAELSLEKMPIPEIVNSILERFEPQADAKRQTISTVVPEGTEVEGDKQKITAIFDNLISNAIKYTGEKGRIDLVVEDRKEDIRVCVADTGIGIPEAQLPMVFERFYTVDASLAGKGGLGLGLAIVKGYVKLHGGKVWVTSEFGKGSKFWFTLPKRQR